MRITHPSTPAPFFRRLLLLPLIIALLPVVPCSAISLEYVFSSTQLSSKSEVPAYEPSGLSAWLVRLQTPTGKDLAQILSNYRDTGTEQLHSIVLDLVATYLPYLITDGQSLTAVQQAIADRDWQAASTLVDRHAQKSRQPDLLALVNAMLNTLQGRFRMAANQIGQIPSEVRTKSPLVWLAQAQLNLESREYANCREQIDKILESNGLPEHQNRLHFVRCSLNYMMDQKDQAAEEFETILRTCPEPARVSTEIGRRLLNSMRGAQARDWFLWALEENAESPEAATGLVLGFIQDSLYMEARQVAGKWLSADIPEHRRLRAELLHLSGDLENALSDARTLRADGAAGQDHPLIALEANLLLDLCRPDEALALLSPLVEAGDPPIELFIAHIRALRDTGRYADIDRLVVDIPTNSSDPGQRRLLRAWWAYEREEFTRCIKDLQLCISDGFKSPAVYALLGAVHYHQHNRMKAQESWEIAHNENSTPPLFLAMEAEANLEAKRLDECKVILKDLLLQQPNSGRLQFLQARLLDARGQHGEAADWCARALVAGAPGRETRLQMAESLLRARRDAEAAKEIEFLVQRYPESPSVVIQQAILSHRTSDFPAATQQAKAVLKNGSAVERARATVLLGLMAIAQNDPNTALDYAESAIRFGAPIASPFLLRGSIRFNQLKYVAAEADFTRAIRLEPELEDGYEWRARTLQSKALFREAIRDYGDAIRLSSTPQKMAARHLQRAICYIELQTWEYASIDLDRAREIAPDMPELLFVQGRLAAAQGSWQEGLDAFNRYLRFRQDPLAVQWRDRCLKALGSPAPAENRPTAVTPEEVSPQEVIYQAIPVASSTQAQPPTQEPVSHAGAKANPLDQLLALTTPDALNQAAQPQPAETRTTPDEPGQPTTEAANNGQSTPQPPKNTPDHPATTTQPASAQSPPQLSLEELRARIQGEPTDLETLLAWVVAEEENGDVAKIREASATLLSLLQADPQPAAPPALQLQAWAKAIDLTSRIHGPQQGYIVSSSALEQFPNELALHLSSAKLAARLGLVDKISEGIQFVLAREPNHVEARLLEIQWLQIKGDHPQIETKFEELLALAPRNPALFTLLARYRASQSDWDRSIEACNSLISMGVDNPEIRRLRAVAFNQKGDESKAMDELARATWLDPDDEETVMLKVNIQVDSGKIDWAIDNLVAFAEKHPESSAPMLRLCQIGWTVPSRRHKVLREWLPTAIERFPEKSEFHALQTRVFIDLNMPKDALVAAGETVRTNPQNAAAWHTLGRLEGGEGQFEKARKYLEQAVSIDPTLSEAWSDLGAVLLQQGETEEAATILSRASTVEPNNPLHFYRLGLALVKGKKFSEAVTAFARVRELQPEWAAAWGQNISALLRAGDRPRAEELRKEAAQKFPQEDWSSIK